MDYNDLKDKYGKVHPKMFDQNIIDKYNKKFLLLTPESYDRTESLISLDELQKYNKVFYTNNGLGTISTSEYTIDLKNYYVTKFIQLEFVEHYNSWPQIHDYSKGDPKYKLSGPGGIPSVEYEPIYFTIAISTTVPSVNPQPSDMLNFTAYALKLDPGSYTVGEFVQIFNSAFSLVPTVAAYGLTMINNNVTNRLIIETTNPNVSFFVKVLDINLTSSPGSFTNPVWYDPLTNSPYVTQPVINNLYTIGSYFTGYDGLPVPTFDLVPPTISSDTQFYTPFNSTRPGVSSDSFTFDMEEFLLLTIQPFNSTMDIANSSHYHNFMIPNSGGRGELNQFNCQSNFKYSLVFENKLVLNKINIKWSFFNGQSCLFYNLSPLILISYVPYETTDSRIPFYLE